MKMKKILVLSLILVAILFSGCTKKTEQPKAQALDENLVTPTTDTVHIKDLNLYKTTEFDINKDKTADKIELYTSAEVTKDKKIMLDDGQRWSLVAKIGNKMYPLFVSTYIQLGDLNYKVFESLEDESFHVFLDCSQSAAVNLVDFKYDKKRDVFVVTSVYEQNGINLIAEE